MTDPGGRYIVARHWQRWAVLDLSWNPPRHTAGPYDHKTDADAEARRLNTPPPQRTQQSLFDREPTA